MPHLCWHRELTPKAGAISCAPAAEAAHCPTAAQVPLTYRTVPDIA